MTKFWSYVKIIFIKNLTKKGFKQQALAVTLDSEHKFDLALQLGDLKIAYTIAKEVEVCDSQLLTKNMEKKIIFQN